MFDAAQAVHSLISGPFVPSSIETQPAPMFGMIDGIENGLTRSGPRVEEHVVALLIALQAADPGCDRGAEAVGCLCDVDARVGLRLARRGEDHLREAVHAPRAAFRSIQTVGSKSFSSHAKWTL